MHSIYAFVTGPLAWAAFILFFAGLLVRLVAVLKLVGSKEPFIPTYMSWKYSLRSILRWLTPFGTLGWRHHPALTVVTFAFHFCLLAAPLFLTAHVMLIEEAWQISWWTLPDALVDVMTVVVVAGCAFFWIRRRVRPEVAYVTSTSDYVLLAIVAAPFVTGFLAYHQWFAYPFFAIAHIVSGEVMLVAIPFTRLSHMVLAPLTRAYMGSEFGKIRHARDW
jgi:nitrate reductase gamma subunit